MFVPETVVLEWTLSFLIDFSINLTRYLPSLQTTEPIKMGIGDRYRRSNFSQRILEN